ncbi:uncharacterized protein LOC133306856 [Gastrolobium bilobum]|uniref:uncharacterized protein LOC133306856 n=1 Tax=Gastrolobium bilobum TaxID=150636 RepID=UPI002AB1BE02|nr:uncharacterized protein LOC133306856 [Gastrolobium bilobum]
MVMALQAKNKYQFVDGSLPSPSPDDLLYPSWVRCNSMVSSCLFHAVTREIAYSVLYIPTAHGIWVDLSARFEQSNAPRIFQLKSQLASLQQGSVTVSAYYTRLKTLWDELHAYQPVPVCNCGGLRTWTQFQEQNSSLQFLMGLNESYSATRAQILLMEPLPSLNRIFSLVVQEERQRSILPGMVPASDLQLLPAVNVAAVPAVNVAAGPPRPRCDRPFCTHCSQQVHTIDKCFKLHGFPPGYRNRTKPTDNQAHSAVVSLQHNGPPSPQLHPQPTSILIGP